MKQDQQTRILSLLAGANGGWVSLPEILNLNIAQYCARIFELRRKGYTIESRSQWMNGQRHSWYRLVSSPVETAVTP